MVWIAKLEIISLNKKKYSQTAVPRPSGPAGSLRSVSRYGRLQAYQRSTLARRDIGSQRFVLKLTVTDVYPILHWFLQWILFFPCYLCSRSRKKSGCDLTEGPTRPVTKYMMCLTQKRNFWKKPSTDSDIFQISSPSAIERQMSFLLSTTWLSDEPWGVWEEPPLEGENRICPARHLSPRIARKTKFAGQILWALENWGNNASHDKYMTLSRHVEYHWLRWLNVQNYETFVYGKRRFPDIPYYLCNNYYS